MAVIKNQKTGMWEVRTYYKDWTGTRRQKTKRGFAKKSEAQEWERAFKLKDEMNINMKFKDFAELYLSDIQPRIKYNSFLTKKHIIETKILPYFGHRKLNEIRPADVIQWQNEIMKLKKDNGEAYSPTYLKTIHNQLSAILNHAVNMYDLKDNVARKAGSMGKEESKEIMFWTQEEYQAFIEQVADNARLFSYAFATVPTVKIDKFKRNSVAVLRVSNLSGGNYWGIKSVSGIASSIKEMLGRNLATGAVGSHKTTLNAELPNLSTTYGYFGL